jgi:ribonuclease Z
MRVHVIGAGCPDPRKERFGSAFLFDVGEERLLIDCGPATTYKMACMGIRPTVVDRLFLTHHHFDHNADVPCFVLTRAVHQRHAGAPPHLYLDLYAIVRVSRLF